MYMSRIDRVALGVHEEDPLAAAPLSPEAREARPAPRLAGKGKALQGAAEALEAGEEGTVGDLSAPGCHLITHLAPLGVEGVVRPGGVNLITALPGVEALFD